MSNNQNNKNNKNNKLDKLDKEFELSCSLVKLLKKKPTDTEMLDLYSLYKQSTIGDCNIQEPSKLNFTDNSKWQSWNKRNGLTQHNAKLLYVDLAMLLIEKYGINESLKKN